jgi:hypothetical protein
MSVTNPARTPFILLDHSGTTMRPLWSHKGVRVTKHRRTKEPVVQSTMRIPRTLWKRINEVAEAKRLSMAQTVERALFCYCYMQLPYDAEMPQLRLGDWKLALEEMKANIERRESEMDKKKQ